MDYATFYNWVLFPSLIFLSRMADVSLGTLRSVLSAKGRKNIVPFIGFFEVLLWLVAISSILKNLNNVMCYIGWAGGYATGIYLGLTIEEKLALGTQVVRVILPESSAKELTEELAKNNFGVTISDGQGARGPVKIIFTIIERKKMKEVVELMDRIVPGAFYSVEEVKSASHGSYEYSSRKRELIGKFFPLRKGK